MMIDRNDKKRVWLYHKENAICMRNWTQMNDYQKGGCEYAIY